MTMSVVLTAERAVAAPAYGVNEGRLVNNYSRMPFSACPSPPRRQPVQLADCRHFNGPCVTPDLPRLSLSIVNCRRAPLPPPWAVLDNPGDPRTSGKEPCPRRIRFRLHQLGPRVVSHAVTDGSARTRLNARKRGWPRTGTADER